MRNAVSAEERTCHATMKFPHLAYDEPALDTDISKAGKCTNRLNWILHYQARTSFGRRKKVLKLVQESSQWIRNGLQQVWAYPFHNFGSLSRESSMKSVDLNVIQDRAKRTRTLIYSGSTVKYWEQQYLRRGYLDLWVNTYPVLKEHAEVDSRSVSLKPLPVQVSWRGAQPCWK